MKKLLLFFISLFLVCNSYAGMQDISSATGGWTHSDAGNTLTETKYRVRSEATDNETTSTYHYKTVSAFTDFTHYFTFGFDSTTGGTAQWGIWGVSDHVLDLENLMAHTDANAVVLSILDTGSICKIYINDKDTSTITRAVNITISEEYRYRPLYGKVVKSGTTFNFYIYREPARTTLLYTLTTTLNDGSQSYTNIFMGMNGGGDYLVYENYIPPTASDDTYGTITNVSSTSQSFTPSSTHNLNRVSIYGEKVTNATGNVTAYIYATDANGCPTGSVLATSSTYDVSTWSTSSAWHDFDFPSPYSVSASTKYVIVWNTTSTVGIQLHVDTTSSSYAGGNRCYGGNPTWTVGANDSLFKEGLVGYTNNISAFSSELWINETPIAIFQEVVSTPLLNPEDYDGFNGFPNSQETWAKFEVTSEFETYQGSADTYGISTFTEYRGQTFTPTTGHRIKYVSIFAAKDGSPGICTLEVQSTSDNLPTNTVLISVTANADAWSISGEWHTFTFTSDYALTASVTYAIVLKCADSGVRWYIDNTSSSYSGGRRCYLSSYPTWNGQDSIDALFKEGGYSTTIVESSNFSSDGDGKSVLITGIDGVEDVGAYFIPSVTTWEGGIVKADVKLTALGNNAKTELLTLYVNSTSAVIAYIEDINGTKYFRLGKLFNTTYTWGTSTKVTCSLNTQYTLVISWHEELQTVILSVNGQFVEGVEVAADLTITHIYIGYFGGTNAYKGGIRYIDNLSYMNGHSLFPSIARGGSDKNTLVASFVQGAGHDPHINNKLHFVYSTDNGLTWTLFHTIQNANDITYCYAVRWCQARQSWFFFIHKRRDALSQYPHAIVYECTAPTGSGDVNAMCHEVNTIRDYDNDSDYFVMYPTRQLDTSGNLYVGLEYYKLDTWNSTYNYLMSARFSWADGVLSEKHKFAQYGEDATYPQVAEPQLWHDNSGNLMATIRHVERVTWLGNTKYRISPYNEDGTSDWYDHTLYNPGTDWNKRYAIMRAFVFRGIAWWQFRDDEPNTGIYTTGGVMKTDINPDDANLLPLTSETWWFSPGGEAGNGDIDACSTCIGTLYLDYVGNIFMSAWYKRLYTGESAFIPKHGFINFQNPGIN